ncbi:hypothetical protein WDW37_02530 [Bdellovibrionota bacterium FG-1]
MASVTPSDGNNSYYMKHINELEDELKRDYARNEQRGRERVDEIEKGYRNSINKHQEKSDQAVEKIRDDFQESSTRSREGDRAELDQMKRSNYDRFGRIKTDEADKYKQLLQQTVESSALLHENDVRNMKASEDTQSKQMEEMSRSDGAKMERAMQEARQTSQENFSQAFQKDRSAGDEQRHELQKRYDGLNQDRMKDAAAQHRELEKIVADSEKSLENQRFHDESAIESRINKNHRDSTNKLEDLTQKMTQTNAEQTTALRDQMKDLVASEGVYVKEKGQGTADAVKEYNDEWRAKLEIEQDSHAREMDRTRQKIKETENYFTASNGRNTKEKDTRFAALMSKVGNENHEQQKDIISRYEKSNLDLESRMKNDRVKAQDQLETALTGVNEQRHVALQNQAKVFRESTEASNITANDKVQRLEKELQRKATVQDTSEVTPAVENAVRKSITKEYDKTMNAETERSRRALEQMRNNYSDRMHTTDEEHTQVLTKQERDNLLTRQQEIGRFREHASAVELEKEEAIRNRDYDHSRETEGMNRSFSQMNQRQRNEFETMIQAVRDDAATKMGAFRQEADFQSKMAHRNFASKQNETIREYDKKIADQKIDYDERIDELRSQLQLTQREGERKVRTGLEDQSRQYEQRIAQLLAQHEEKERSMTQNFQEEIEKVRRSHVINPSKKS